MNMDKPHEECGVFGIYNTTGCNVAHTKIRGLFRRCFISARSIPLAMG